MILGKVIRNSLRQDFINKLLLLRLINELMVVSEFCGELRKMVALAELALLMPKQK